MPILRTHSEQEARGDFTHSPDSNEGAWASGVKDETNLQPTKEDKKDVDRENPGDLGVGVGRELMRGDIGVKDTNGVDDTEARGHAA